MRLMPVDIIDTCPSADSPDNNLAHKLYIFGHPNNDSRVGHVESSFHGFISNEVNLERCMWRNLNGKATIQVGGHTSIGPLQHDRCTDNFNTIFIEHMSAHNNCILLAIRQVRDFQRIASLNSLGLDIRLLC